MIGWGIYCEMPRWLSLNLTNDEFTFIQVKAWFRQATSHCLSQCGHMASQGHNELISSPNNLKKYGSVRENVSKWFRSLENPNIYCTRCSSLHWRHNEHDSVSNHQPNDCLLKHLFRRRSKTTSKLRVTGLCKGIYRSPVNSPHKGPVTRKTFPFDDVIMLCTQTTIRP